MHFLVYGVTSDFPLAPIVFLPIYIYSATLIQNAVKLCTCGCKHTGDFIANKINHIIA